MKNSKRLGFYLLLNVIVSAGTMWVVFNIGIRKFPEINTAIPTPVNVATSATLDESISVNDEVITSPGQLEISLVLGTGDIETERVLIKHKGEEEINMSGWKLIDEDGNEFTFPILTLFSGAAVSVHTKTGVLTVIDLYWEHAQSVWSIGELVKLVDPTGTIHAQYLIP